MLWTSIVTARMKVSLKLELPNSCEYWLGIYIIIAFILCLATPFQADGVYFYLSIVLY